MFHVSSCSYQSFEYISTVTFLISVRYPRTHQSTTQPHRTQTTPHTTHHTPHTRYIFYRYTVDYSTRMYIVNATYPHFYPEYLYTYPEFLYPVPIRNTVCIIQQSITSLSLSSLFTATVARP